MHLFIYKMFAATTESWPDLPWIPTGDDLVSNTSKYYFLLILN